MTDASMIRLGGEDVEVAALGFAFLRRGLPRIQGLIEWTNLRLSDMPALLAQADRQIPEAAELIAAASGRKASDIEALRASLGEVIGAILVIADLSGLLRKDDARGEAPAGTSTGA
jgi:hypothetical protein